MPRIPRAQGSGELTRQAPAVKVNPEQFGIGGEAVQQGAKQLEQLNQKYVELDTVNKVNEEERNLRNGLSKLQMDYSQDPDLQKNKDSYEKRMNDLRANAGASIYDPKARSEFDAKADYYVNAEKVQFTNKLVDHQQNLARADLLDRIRTNKENFAQSFDPRWLEESRSAIDQGLRVGYITADNAIKIEESLKEDFGSFKFERDMVVDPEIAKQNILDGKYNEYMNQEQKTKALSKVDAAIKQRGKANRRLMSNAKDQNEITYAQAALNGDLNLEAFQHDRGADMVLPEVGQAIQNYHDSEFGNFEYLKGVKDETNQFPNDSKTYNDLYSRANSDAVRADPRKAKQVVVDLFQAGSQGKINNASMREILGDIAPEFQHAAVNERTSWTRKLKTAYIDSARKALASLPDPQKAMEDFSKAYYGIDPEASDEDRRKRVNEIVGNLLRKGHPALVGLDQIPENVYDAFGLVKRIWNGEIKSAGHTGTKKEPAKPGK